MNMRQQNGQGGHGNRRHGRGGGNNRHGGGNNRHSGGGGNGGGNRNNSQVPLRNQIFDSHGPEGVRVRGNAFQVWEKYMAMAREAGEREEAENLYQHAEHYYRIVQAIQEVEAEQRARFAPTEQPATGDQPAADGEQPVTDPFAMAPATAADGDTGLTDLRPAAVQ